MADMNKKEMFSKADLLAGGMPQAEVVSRVSISEDRMSATLVYVPDKENEKEPSVGDLVAFLKENGVKQGILTDVLELMVENRQFGIEVEAAVGKQPTVGKDGEFIFHVEDSTNSGKPKVLEDGTVDYKNISQFVMVEAGDLLAEYVPATKGVYGYTVEGKFLMPLSGKEKPQLKGKGFLLSEDKRLYTAAISGKVDRAEDQISVSNILTVSGDVDMSVGNLDFDGEIVITGNVCQGMTVSATGSIQVQGHVESAVLRAGKDIVLAGGMQGNGECLVLAGNDVSGKFFEYVIVRAGRNIIANYLLGCDAQATGSILVSGRRGMIIGGTNRAFERIEAAKIGNNAEVPTTIELGVDQSIVTRYSELTKLIEKADKNLALLHNSRHVFESHNQTSHPTCVLVDEALEKETAKREELDKERTELSEQITKCRRAVAVVHSTLYPGCRIILNMESMTTTQEYNNVRVKLVKREITMIPGDS